MLAQVFGRSHQLGRNLDQVLPPVSLHPVPEGGKSQHLISQIRRVVGVDLFGQEF